MAYGSRWGYRRQSGFRSRRRRSYRPYRYRRFRSSRLRFRRRRASGTRSAIVKLSFEGTFTPWDTTRAGYKPFSCAFGSINGFTDYADTYSQFRVAKIVLTINRTTVGTAEESLLHFLTVPSRTFAQTAGNFQSPVQVSQLVPPVSEAFLRQAKWQKEHRPSNIRPYIRVAFKPYTMSGTSGPIPDTGSGGLIPDYFRVWNYNKWTPMSWAVPNGGTALIANTMFGPYIVPNKNTNDARPDDLILNYTATVYCQFKGQR
ncbi:capsid protein [Northern red-backed vole stool-associated circular virus 116]|uniref:Capsid protein n=1 Tax=Northern red-backed vole stool-associated circular virus 116 TaxID=2714165 RepID=A0AAE6X3J1_9VIRU|nr:capsid protein [Northern red-backed vole stool-associated circular virus 116]QIK03937.1 capsid protein [Northern red-backed vole stool-associated circular virus 116]